MLNLQKEKLELVRGGCYCYCFKYPYSAFNVCPFVGIGETEDRIACEKACLLDINKEQGYYGFNGCTTYPKIEAQPTPEFRKRVEEILAGRENSKQWEDNLF